MNQKSLTLSFKYLLVLIVLIPISSSVFAEKNKLLIIADTWPQMDVLADGLMTYIINKANEEEIELIRERISEGKSLYTYSK